MAFDFVCFLPQGSSRPFIAKDDRERIWVVKFHGNPLGTKSSFNEFVSGSLANAIGLPWPIVKIATLSDATLGHLVESGYEPKAKDAVAIEFIDGLLPVELPKSGPRALKKENHQHVISQFPNSMTHSAFYGKMLFDNWVLIEDSKYDTLHIAPDRSPIFLDASFAFGGDQWDSSKLRWSDEAFNILSPYLEGMITDLSQFDIWLDKLSEVDVSLISRIMNSIPPSWHVPPDYIQGTITFLSKTARDFVPIARRWIEYRESC